MTFGMDELNGRDFDVLEDMSDGKEQLSAFKTYAKNSAIPAIIKRQNNNQIVSMIIIADNDMRELINKYKDDSLDIQTTTYVENVHEGKEKNLVMRFDMYFPHAHALYEGVVYDDPEGQQKEFAGALRKSDYIDLIVTNENRGVERIIPVKWDNDKAGKVLENFM